MKNKILITLGLMATVSCIDAAPLGVLEPYNFMIEAEPVLFQSKFQFNLLTQIGFETQGFNIAGNTVNPLQIYETQQNIFGLYQGLETQTSFTQLINSLAGGPGSGVNNSQNGLFSPTGDFDIKQVAFLGSYMFYPHCFFKISVPVYKMALKNVTWTYTGNNETFAGQAIQNQLVNSFITDAATNFDLSLTDWQQDGFGDIALLLDYICDYPQGRPLLRNVRAHLRLGLTVPTGVVADPNKIMSIPFGNDGTVGLPFGGGLDINLGRYFQCGFRAQFLYLWGNEKLRRIKTFTRQTSLLYPQVVPTYTDYGFNQQFDLYIQGYNMVKGLSLKLAYEYFRKAPDLISVQNSGVNYTMLNTDPKLDEITRNNMIMVFSFDSGFLDHCPKIHPQASIFVNLPFNASNIIAASTYGLQLSLDF